MDEDEIFFDPNAGFKIHPVSEDYTHQRIKRILENDFNCHLENIWQGYKANRKPGYHEIYNLVDNATGKIIGSGLPLDHFRSLPGWAILSMMKKALYMADIPDTAKG